MSLPYKKTYRLLVRNLSIALLLVVSNTNAQDLHFSQFYEAPMLRNPALAGIFSGDFRAQAIYRSQWASVTVPYKTGSINMEYKKPIGNLNDFLTIGGQVAYDQAGLSNFKTSQILPQLTFHKSLNGNKNSYLSLGAMAGYVQRSIDPNKITTDNQFTGAGYNPALASGESIINYSLGYFDASIGLSYNASFGEEPNPYNNFFIGAAIHHLNRPNNSFYRNPASELFIKYVISTGLKMLVDDKSYFTIHADYNTQGGFQEIIGAALYTTAIDGNLDEAQYKISAGTMLRWKDAIIPVIKLDIKRMAVAFSYDVNTSQLKAASQSRGAFELSITSTSFFDRNNSTKNALRCPSF
jgi:type IX secretion system PorP/SprF family membrane protein